MAVLTLPAGRWSGGAPPLFKWARTIDSILERQPLDPLDGPSMHIFTDYSGDHKTSKYHVTTAVYMDMDASMSWHLQRQAIRDEYLPDGRRLSFKGLNDRTKQRALVPFLEASDLISGMCLSIAVHKAIPPLCADETSRSRLMVESDFAHRWNTRAFDRMLQVSHLIALLAGRLSLPGQNVYWFSDEDALFANASATGDLKKMVDTFSSYYVGNRRLGQLGSL